MTVRNDRLPALTASALLHGGLFALAFLALPKDKLPELIGQAVPVTVVASAPEADVRPAVKAPEPAPAASQEPEPSPLPPAPVESPAPPPPAPKPLPAPKPAPPPPAPKPVLRPKPAPPPTPQPKPAAKAAPKPDLDLGKLAASLPSARAKPQALDLGALASSLPSARQSARASRSLDLDALTSSLPTGGSRRAAGARGPARAETAAQARPAVGAATNLSADELGALRAKLIRLWSPNCGVEGAGSVIARVRMRLASDGSLAGAPELVDTSGDAPAAVVQAAGVRAVSAVARGAPYSEIPRERLKVLHDFVFRFDAKQACR